MDLCKTFICTADEQLRGMAASLNEWNGSATQRCHIDGLLLQTATLYIACNAAHSKKI
ncbi:hypothetical protein J6590_065717 [Homalodisca vitripennis]|nr:hypothetical protein J6590_065717 [Homalodisca vitripennis]